NSELPWLSLNEKIGHHCHPENLTEAFNVAFNDCYLLDIGMEARKFTWERGKGTQSWVEERIDRVVANANGCSLLIKTLYALIT
ncbi:hypothetical protein ABN262_23530, partial [Citrobacter youngae]|uniref:hypothetical protein n=1 Tax=Citrobacter youngae TaxID=133448 RepID=UPI0032DB4575